MTVLTVKAQDTATAMEEIVEKLGKDSFIIGTKRNLLLLLTIILQ